jgi:site-specific recombinase XerD
MAYVSPHLPTLLKANGEDIKTVQELLRHATVKMTLEVYAQAVTPAKRQAQSKVAEMLKEKVGAELDTRSYWTFRDL